MPRPSAEEHVRPVGRADRVGRHRRGWSVPQEVVRAEPTERDRTAGRERGDADWGERDDDRTAGWEADDGGNSGERDDDGTAGREADDGGNWVERDDDGTAGLEADDDGTAWEPDDDVAWGEALLAGGEDEADGAGGEDSAGGQDREEGTRARVPLISVPESLRSLDVQVGTRAVRGLLLLAVVVVLVLGGRWWWVQQGADAVPVEQVEGGAEQVVEQIGPGPGSESEQGVDDQAASAAARSAGGAEGNGTADEAAEIPADLPVVVHVVGEVRRPGIVELPPGARVADAVAAVGGLTDEADQASLNLARALVDGEQVWVGAPGEEPPPGVLAGGGTSGVGTGTTGASGGGAADGSGAAGGVTDLNHATQADLEELPGIGPVTAGHILAWREQHGAFSTVEELMEISGIGERTFAQLEPLVTVGG